MELTTEQPAQFGEGAHTVCEPAERGRCQHPKEAASDDPAVLRAALIRESGERRRAECRANMQTEVVRLALDLLVREPDIEGFFGALSKTMVEESESHTCAVWPIDEEVSRCQLWMAYVNDRLFMPKQGVSQPCAADDPIRQPFPCESMATHLFSYEAGWSQTVEYPAEDPRLPELIRDFNGRNRWDETVATPLRLGNRTLGWMTVCSPMDSEPESRW